MSTRVATARRRSASTLANNYYNRFAPETPLAVVAHTERKRGLEKFLDRLKRIDPKEATDTDLFETINVLLRAGASQAYLATTIGVGKATINRWSNQMTAPQPIVREIAITRSTEILEELIRFAKIS